MKCYFVRHAAAVNADEWKGDDFDRPLTDKGRARMKEVARRLAALEIDADAIVSSPLVRAAQTAAIVGDALSVAVVEDERLGGGFDVDRLAGILRDRSHADAIVLVGHEPGMSATIGHAIGGARVDFKKGAIACVEIRDPSAPAGELLWMAPPKILVE